MLFLLPGQAKGLFTVCHEQHRLSIQKGFCAWHKRYGEKKPKPAAGDQEEPTAREQQQHTRSQKQEMIVQSSGIPKASETWQAVRST